MKLENTLTIPVPVREAWQVLLDIERIAPCVPGATLTSNDGDTFHGKVKVKLGPIGLSYNGTVTFVSLDETERVAVLEASGRETRGGGTAKATVTCRLTDQGDTTDVHIETDLAITGKPAQFGRGALNDVATNLIGQFAANLADELTSTNDAGGDGEGDGEGAGDPSPAPALNGEAPRAEPAPPRTAPAARAPAEPINLLPVTGGGLLKAAGPIAAATALVVLLVTIRRQRSATSPLDASAKAR
ncbi:SRPBCC family protein [Actinomadura rugatobispora]|uniref:SRPBCC family protein n=1 Tax=Actinomadura rugatobispora TaxID=1994 RepID=A0ABW1AKG4_9ACTN|nr:SRPBCC family protein [Actinomadura rugatobispora]